MRVYVLVFGSKPLSGPCELFIVVSDSENYPYGEGHMVSFPESMATWLSLVRLGNSSVSVDDVIDELLLGFVVPCDRVLIPNMFELSQDLLV